MLVELGPAAVSRISLSHLPQNPTPCTSPNLLLIFKKPGSPLTSMRGCRVTLQFHQSSRPTENHATETVHRQNQTMLWPKWYSRGLWLRCHYNSMLFLILFFGLCSTHNSPVTGGPWTMSRCIKCKNTSLLLVDSKINTTRSTCDWTQTSFQIKYCITCTGLGFKNKTAQIFYTVHKPDLDKHMTALEEGNMNWRVKGEKSLHRDLSQKNQAIFSELV